MTNVIIYRGREVKTDPSTFTGTTVDVITPDRKRHVAVPLAALDTRWK